MPPRPFPLPLGIGTDIVQVSRIKDLLSKSGSDRITRFLRRFLTAREQHELWARFDRSQAETTDSSLTRHLSGRWAAKEAVIKAVNWRKLSFSEIQILARPGNDKNHAGSGAIYALILDKPASPYAPGEDTPTRAAQDLQSRSSSGASYIAARHDTGVDAYTPFEEQTDSLAGQVARISISHDGDYATAVCIAAEGPREGDVGGEAAAREPL